MTLQHTFCDVLAVVADINNLLPVQKQKAKIVQYHEMYGKFFKVWSKIFHILTRSWMRGWTWTNDNNKHKYKNSDSGNFSMMIKLKECIDILFISKVWCFSLLHHRCTIEYQYSCQYSYEYLSTCPRVRVQVRVLWLWNSRVRVHYEYQKFSTRVWWVRVLSTSTPALVDGSDISLVVLFLYLITYIYIQQQEKIS